MKVVLLAGGYATRLLPLTKNTPKALLEVGERTILEHMLHQLEQMPRVKLVYITTNEKFASNFEKFLANWKGKKKVELIIEKGLSERAKKGSVGALLHLHDKGLLDQRTMVLAADNLFGPMLVDTINSLTEGERDFILLSDVREPAVASHYGVCELDAESHVAGFTEKPEKPKSTLVSTGCYVLSKEILDLLPEYEKTGGGTDRMGDFIKWLVARAKLHGVVFKGKWFDIGSHEQLEQARKEHS